MRSFDLLHQIFKIHTIHESHGNLESTSVPMIGIDHPLNDELTSIKIIYSLNDELTSIVLELYLHRHRVHEYH